MSAYPTLDFLDDLTRSEMNWAWRLELDPVRDPELGQFYGRTARYSTTDPYAGEDDIFVFHATAGMGYTVQSGSYHDPFQLRIYDDAGNAIAADDGSGAYGYDYAVFTAAYTGWYYIDASWDQDYYDTYASVNVYESRFPTTTRIIGTDAHDTLYGTRTNDIVDGGTGIDTFVLEGRPIWSATTALISCAASSACRSTMALSSRMKRKVFLPRLTAFTRPRSIARPTRVGWVIGSGKWDRASHCSQWRRHSSTRPNSRANMGQHPRTPRSLRRSTRTCWTARRTPPASRTGSARSSTMRLPRPTWSCNLVKARKTRRRSSARYKLVMSSS
jgi:hypothetical protein